MNVFPVSSVLLLSILTDGIWVSLWIPSNSNPEVVSVLPAYILDKVEGAGEAALHLDKAVLTLGRIAPEGQHIPDAVFLQLQHAAHDSQLMEQTTEPCSCHSCIVAAC